MAARAMIRLASLAAFLGALLTCTALASAQSATPRSATPGSATESNHTAGLGEIIAAVTASSDSEPLPARQRKRLYPSFSQHLDGLFTELLQRPSALSPKPLARETAPSAQGLGDMLDRAHPPAASDLAPASFTLDEVVTRSREADSAGVQSYGSERGRRRALLDALRIAVPSDGDILR